MEYLLTQGIGKKKLTALFSGEFTIRGTNPAKRRSVLFDTFDWRLGSAGQKMEEIREGRKVWTEWRDVETDGLLGRADGPLKPFAADWPMGPLSERLAQVIKMRALLPLVRQQTTLTTLELCDGRKKIVARLTLQKTVLVDAKGVKIKELEPHLKISPLRGYQRELARVRALLQEELHLLPLENTQITRIFNEAGLKSKGYSSKVNVKLTGEMRAEEAVRMILANLHSTMAANLGGTINDVDTEFLHDFRVAVRRTRSALGQMKSAVPVTVLKKYRGVFGDLGALTGPTRDLDVYLLKFDRYAAMLSQDSALALAPLREHITARQDFEQAKMARELKGKAFKLMMAKWEELLTHPFKSSSKNWEGRTPIGEFGGRRILKIHKRVLKLGALLMDESPPPAVHALRIACKKLRYMIEFMKSLYPSEKVAPLLTALKGLQDTLGDFQDYEVHRLELYKFAEEMSKKKSVPPRTLLAMGELAQAMAQRQKEARERIGGDFARFADHSTTSAFREVFSVSQGKDSGT